MIKTDPIRCTYCESVQVWSSEQTDRTMMGENYQCPNCGQETHICDDHAIHEFEDDRGMSWVSAEPLY
jgi:DNA-directed RNA polymerase subunit RPC12/RpoP